MPLLIVIIIFLFVLLLVSRRKGGRVTDTSSLGNSWQDNTPPRSWTLGDSVPSPAGTPDPGTECRAGDDAGRSADDCCNSSDPGDSGSCSSSDQGAA